MCSSPGVKESREIARCSLRTRRDSLVGSSRREAPSVTKRRHLKKPANLKARFPPPAELHHTRGQERLHAQHCRTNCRCTVWPLREMLTFALTFFSANNSLCNLSDFSSAPSACSCKNLIFRLTASSDEAPVIVNSKTTIVCSKKKEERSRNAISERTWSCRVTSWLRCKAGVRAFRRRTVCVLPIQEVPLIFIVFLFFKWKNDS